MKNKPYILKIRAQDKDIFEAVKSGKKKIETRGAIEDYRKIGKGDTIVFICGKNKLAKKVKAVKLYKSIGALFKDYKISDIFPEFTEISQARKKYYSFPNYRANLKKYGLIAWELR